MRSLFMKTCLHVALALGMASVAFAQAPAEAPAPATESTAPAAAKSPLDVEADTGGYSYNPGGRRDPFVSLQKPVAADRGPKSRKPGMEGFLIQEIALKGIVRTAGGGTGVASKPGFIAVFLGTDGKSYFVTNGQRLFDGVITAVEAGSVTFLQEVTDPLSPVKSREVKKSLNASEEARQ
jgi:Tfp pilus assembly protein PilP